MEDLDDEAVLHRLLALKEGSLKRLVYWAVAQPSYSTEADLMSRARRALEEAQSEQPPSSRARSRRKLEEEVREMLG